MINGDSHDSKTAPKRGDFEAIWKDALELEKLFTCEDCKSNVSEEYKDSTGKNITCKCGKLSYAWS